MISSNDLSSSISTEGANIQMQGKIDTAEDLYGSYVLTGTGSGLRIPNELEN